MKRILACLAVASFSFVARSAVGEGENLLINGTFDTEQADLPQFWSPSSSRHVLCHPAGGPEGRTASVVLHSDGSVPGTISMRQQGLILVAGETYKLSAWIKTKDFASRHNGLVVHNSGWIKDIGFKDLPADADWTFHERTFTLFESKNREFGMAMFAVGLTGEIHFADLRLEAVSEGAREGSSSQMAVIAAPRLVPVQPLLNRIPLANPELTLRLFGKLPEPPAAYECVVTVDARIPRQTLALDRDRLAVRLDGLPVGDYPIAAVLRHRESGDVLVETTFAASIIAPPAIDRSGIRPLNNLVSELLAQPLAVTPAEQSFRFVNPHDGWVFVALETADPGPALAVAIDGETVVTAATDRHEAFRELAAGEHRIAVAGNTATARLVVRSIPEIFNYPPCVNSFVRENGDYDWPFMKRHILPAVTTLNGGRLPGEALDEAKAMGLKWLANFNVAPMDDPVELRRRMEQHPGMTQPQYDGLTSDELFFGRTTIDTYTKALWALENPEQRLIYTWVVGKPAIPALHVDFISACLNASKGRGRLLYEAYCRPQVDEATAAAYLDGMVTETMRQLEAYFPNAAAGTGIIFGNFNQIPIISLEHQPSVDFKYFLDMQVNLVANQPEFANLATTGYWGTYYGDEELARWSFLLMRHYAVEGRRDMLSDQYGFTYNPGHVINPDFAEGLDGWTASPAAEGSIVADTIPNFGKDIQRRWNAGKTGDTACVMVRQPGQPNRISQTLRGLEVGKAYSLQFVTADRTDIAEKRHNPRQYGIAAELGGAALLPDRCFVHIDRRQTHRRLAPENLGKTNLHRIVFRATAPTHTLVFSDEPARPGEELAFNFVQLKPYLE